MIEYLYDAIRATAGEDITISAKITDAFGVPVTEGCHINLYDDEKQLTSISGTFNNDLWEFTIPAAETANLTGRYWYCVCSTTHNKLNFKQPIYLV